MPDAATELARQTFEGVQALRAVVGSLEGKMITVAKLVGEDHDSITTMKGALESIQSSGRDTATASLRVADLAEEKAKRETAKEEREARALELNATAEREQASRRFRFIEDNWQKVALVVLVLGGFNVQPILAYFGVAPIQKVAISAPPPVADTAPTPTESIP
ncbi:MAG: hypothetical protein HRU00_14210 [Myxococcales bacterium]|nr:hypothetical protein [Myxococcales bacterium]